MTPFISILITLAIAGLIVWAITYFIPMPATFKTAILALAGLFCLFYLRGAVANQVPPFIDILITLAIAGLIVWAIVFFIPMPDKFRTAILVLAGVLCLFYMLDALGFYHLDAFHRRPRPHSLLTSPPSRSPEIAIAAR